MNLIIGRNLFDLPPDNGYNTIYFNIWIYRRIYRRSGVIDKVSGAPGYRITEALFLSYDNSVIGPFRL